MSPSANNAGMELPPPVAEQLSQPNVSRYNVDSQPEQASSSPENNAGAITYAVPPASIPLPVNPLAATSQQSDDSNTTQTAGQQSNDDKDLIDKEWVNKAKLIIERSQDDPYKQSEELSGLKADYMKKQFNKTIKLSK